MNEIVPVGQPTSPVESAVVSIVKTLVEGGLPQVIAGPAGKAISRLIGGAADIPAAWLESKAQAIRDEKEARSAVIKKMSGSVADLANANPELTQRAMERWLGKELTKQQNVEAVAEGALKVLQEETDADADGLDVDDVWLNHFIELAERASAEHVKSRLSRMLAREIRHKNSFSPLAMQALAIIDSYTWSIFCDVANFVIDERSIIQDDKWNSGQNFANIQILRDHGLVSEQVNISTEFKFNSKDEIKIIELNRFGIVVRPSSSLIAQIGIILLTRAGRELIGVVDRKLSDDDAMKVAKAVKHAIGTTFSVDIGTISDKKPGEITVINTSSVEI